MDVDFKPDSIFQSIEFDFALLKVIFQRLHHFLVIGGIVTSNPSNLLI